MFAFYKLVKQHNWRAVKKFSYAFFENIILFPVAKEFGKLAEIWRSYWKILIPYFFEK